MNKYLYNHQVLDAIPPPNQMLCFDEDTGNAQDDPFFSIVYRTYPGRVLGATHPEDVIQIHPRFMCEWEYITGHYDRIGLQHTHHVVWDDSPDVAHEYPDHTLSTFFFGTHAHGVRPDERFYRIVQRMNSKNACMRLCKMLSIPTPHTVCYDCKPEGDVETPLFPLYLKTDTSLSGRGVVRCKDRETLERVLAHIQDDTPFQLQEEVRDAVAFINVQYRVHNGVLSRSLITEQILEGNEHKGNRYPAPHDPWVYTDPLANYMHAQGMQGVFAFDLAVDVHGALYILECNPRYNGSSYPSAVADKLDIPQWSACSFGTRFRSLAEVRLGELEYNEEKKCGVVLVNWGAIQVGALGVMLVGTQEMQEELAMHLRDILM